MQEPGQNIPDYDNGLEKVASFAPPVKSPEKAQEVLDGSPPHDKSPKMVKPKIPTEQADPSFISPVPKKAEESGSEREPRSMAKLLSSIKSPKGVFRGADLDKIKFVTNKRNKCLDLVIETRECVYDEEGKLLHPEEEFGSDSDPFEELFNNELAYIGNYDGSEPESDENNDSIDEESLKQYIMHHGGFSNATFVPEYGAKYKNLRESEIRRDMEQHLNVDFGSEDNGNQSNQKSFVSESEDFSDANSNNLGDQLNDY